ncbi:Putative restriction modification system specificity subunit protein [Halorhabdus tiamatea SARL4B]|uniref:Putative restriction modification system specificity subunit protein n=1 Tax=Halorhabdus tiamatea SARL4B TaxID=1033806 RepID=S6CT69_9EURY|nr:restriction endonuclease subunit S [Halorhabdus tiamatea]ERJ07641.1 Putative restriction modification system specificity subunit protein [Halorhabdus tiamatea SARL4B]CCQ32702.1 type I restriction-modification system, specificity subunit S [Halorhabdus tiamatea SARL4B]
MSEAVAEDEKRDGYMRVQLGPTEWIIPEEWEITSIEDCADYIAGTTFPKEYQGNSSGELPFYKVSDMSECRWKMDRANNYISKDKAEELNATIASSETTIFPKLGQALLTNKRRILTQPSVFDNNVAGLVGKDILDRYLFYFLNFTDFSPYANSGTVPSLSKGDIQSIKLPLPPQHEQRRIADILSTVDKQIQQTDEIIGNIEDLRFGLMSEFFHTGYFEHSLTEKPTFGQVPEDWEIHELSQVADVEMGSSPKSEYYNETGEGLPFYQANNEFGYRNPTHDRWCSNPNKTADEGDTLVTIRGTYVGQVNVAKERCSIGRGLAAVSAKDVDQEYIYHHLAHRERYVKSIASGSTFDSINSNELESLSVLVPPPDEQQKIASCLKSLQKKYLAERKYKQKLQELKRGLMQDLLTGTVRVDPD